MNYTDVASIPHRSDKSRDRLRMAQKPINPNGGEADVVAVRLPPGCGGRVQEMARRRGMNRSEYLRSVLVPLIEAEYGRPPEVASKAS